MGFHSRNYGPHAPVATGNWGCGAFRGNAKLKTLLQLMACSAAGRDMVYFTFGDVTLRDELYQMSQFLAANEVTVSEYFFNSLLLHVLSICCSKH